MTTRNKRKKSLFGIDDAILIPAAISLVSTAISAGKSIYDTKKQTDATQKTIDEQNAAAIKNSNLQNSSILQSNIMQLATSQQNENKNKIIPTQTSALKLGGRRCKKNCGGRLTKFI